MNFFQSQDKARSKTRMLVLGFILSIILIVLLIDAAVIYLSPDPRAMLYINYINFGIVAVIFFGSIKKYFDLRAGGKSITSMLNATPIFRDNPEPKYQQLINVVDEISIAAGISSPMLYVLENEAGINAFVAGYNPNDTVLVVTRGAIDLLSRGEMQGVIAHEYSHIFNSDTTLNLRILVILSGLFMISQVGYIILRTRGDNKNNIAIIGLAVFVLGYIGLFFGNVLKAAISRQRETLADASAVQYTRDPTGITVALLKISRQGKEALMQNAHASEVNHMCFSKANTMMITDIFATHPKLEKRIAVLDPSGEISAEFAHGILKEAPAPQSAKSNKAQPNFIPGVAALAGAQIIASIGNPTQHSLSKAENILSGIPSGLKQMVDTTDSAQALMYAMLIAMGQDPNYSDISISTEIKEKISYCLNFDEIQDHTYRATLIDLAIPTLKKLDPVAIDTFLTNMYSVSQVDKKLTLFEAIMLTIVTERLRANTFKQIKPKFSDFKSVSTEVCCILWFLAQHGSENVDEQNKAYTAAIKHIDASITLQLVDQEFVVRDLVNSLTRLRLMQPGLKEQFLQACVICVTQDNIVEVEEAELLRAVCSCLDCPVPLL